MENKLRKLICAFSVMMFSLAISSCQGGNSEQPKYDGRVFDISAGALLWCMIFIMMSLSASISFIPM